MDSSIPLAVAAALFLGVIVWRVRPAVGFGRRPGASRQALAERMARAEAATTDAERAIALCDAADLLATRGAKGMYLRAVRLHPGSPLVVARAVAALSKRPRALEVVLWRHLSSSVWTETREATCASLEALRALYEGPLHSGVRARAMAHALQALRA